MRKVILAGLVLVVGGVIFAGLMMVVGYVSFAAEAPAPRPPVAERPIVQPRVRTLDSPLVWVATVDRESVKLQDADTALLGGQSFLTGKSLAQPHVRIWIPADRVRVLAEFTSRDDLEDFDDDDVLTKDDAPGRVEIDAIEMNPSPQDGSEPPAAEADDDAS